MAPTEKCNEYNVCYSFHFTLKLSVQEVTGILTGTVVVFLGPSRQKMEILTRLPDCRFLCNHFRFVIYPIIQSYHPRRPYISHNIFRTIFLVQVTFDCVLNNCYYKLQLNFEIKFLFYYVNNSYKHFIYCIQFIKEYNKLCNNFCRPTLVRSHWQITVLVCIVQSQKYIKDHQSLVLFE